MKPVPQQPKRLNLNQRHILSPRTSALTPFNSSTLHVPVKQITS